MLTAAGKGFLMRILPHRTIDNVIDGGLITFRDMTYINIGSQERKSLAAIIKDSTDTNILHNLSGNILAWNLKAEKTYSYSKEEALNMNITKIIPSGFGKKT